MVTVTDVLSGPALTVPWRRDGWTVDDLPEDVDVRYELVDGSLVVSPSPDLRHDDLAAQLLLVVGPRLPLHLRAALAPGLHFDPRNYRQPDLLVYRREAVERGRAAPADAVLVVEVMSPGSVSTDRVAKPAQYAAAGIPHFWRVEFEPLVLVAHSLVEGGYREHARFADEVVVSDPVPLHFRLTDLLV